MKPFGAGEDLDAFSLLEPVARLLPDHARVVVRPLLGDGSGRNPHFPDLDSRAALVASGVFEPEELARALHVVGIEMRETEHIQVVAIGVIEVPAHLAGEADPLSSPGNDHRGSMERMPTLNLREPLPGVKYSI